MTAWLEIQRGDAPLVVCFPHTGTDLGPLAGSDRLQSPWLAGQDADHHVHRLYDFAGALGATTVRTTLSRTLIDVNRDPSGASLYPGQATTELCPLTTFDGQPLYRPGAPPDAAEIAQRRADYFSPYHDALAAELARLRARHARVVVYDAHAIRSRIPRLFAGTLPHLNIGSNDGRTCHPELATAVQRVAERSGFSHVMNGRFKGGWTTRHYGEPGWGVHAVQMELSFRSFLDEPEGDLDAENWPPPFEPTRAAPLGAVLADVLRACLEFAGQSKGNPT